MGILYNTFTLVTISSFWTIFVFTCEIHRNEIAVKNFRDYLRINTAQFNPDYESAITWIEKQARDLDLKYNIIRFPDNKVDFAIWLTWPGLNPSLESVYLYSHIDVVAVEPEGWKHHPFEADIDADGNIFGRGAQDMKSVGVQYLEAIRNLKAQGYSPNRTVHVGFVSGEELGGGGFKYFVLTPEFKALNIGFVLDEGMVTDDPTKFNVYYGMRQAMWFNVTAVGDTGHGSLLLNNTAAVKILKVINRLMEMRESEKSRLNGNKTLLLGEVSSINLGILKGGLEANVIPSKFSAVFDWRFSPDASFNEVMEFLEYTCRDAGPNVTFEIIQTTLRADRVHSVTRLDEEAWWWTNFQKAFQKLNLTAVPRVYAQGSDGQITRNIGIPTLGFSPIYNTTMLFHSRDEYLNVDVFLRGIKIYETIIEALTYVPPSFSRTDSTKNPPKGKSAASVTTGRSFSYCFLLLVSFFTICFTGVIA